jgi:hypothetical protein
VNSAIIALVVVVAWFALMQFILWAASFLGWRPFARHYATTETPDGDWLTWRTAKVGVSNYSGCLSFVVTEAGLYMRPMWLFSMGHRPLLLPWNELRVTFHKAWHGGYYEVRADRVPRWTIQLPKSFGEVLAGRMTVVPSEPEA